MYPCHSLVVSVDVASGKQTFFMGHTGKVRYSHLQVMPTHPLPLSSGVLLGAE